jgi:hypothetical protein
MRDSYDKDRDKLVALRTSVARVAQHMGVQTDALRVLGKGISEICALAEQNESEQDWDDLVWRICDTFAGVRTQ